MTIRTSKLTMTRKCSVCGAADSGHNSRTCPGGGGVRLFGVTLAAAPQPQKERAGGDRQKGVPWTEEEHRQFLDGLDTLGRGDWRGIARRFVVSRTPTQVASHAQKYFAHLEKVKDAKRKGKSSVFDTVLVADDGGSDEALDASNLNSDGGAAARKPDMLPCTYPMMFPACYPAFYPHYPVVFPLPAYGVGAAGLPAVPWQPESRSDG